jgi:phage host-nuclease inhibitor protein Gam
MAKKTYYKYKPREVETLINWGEIGKTITDQLSAQAAARQQTRDDVRQQEADFAQKISEAPQGVTEDSNAKIIKFGNDLSDAMLLNTRMLRSGAINLRDYQLKTNNLKTGTQSFFDIANKFNEMYTQRLTDAEEGKTLDADLWLGELTQNLGGSGSQLYIDPNNFVVGITQTETGEDGVTKSKGKPMPLNVLLPAQNQRFFKEDITGEINNEVKKLGDIIRSSNEGRTITEDARLEPERYNKWKNAMIKKFTSTPKYLLNVLSQFNYDMVENEDGKLVPSLDPINYEYVLNEEDAGGNKIYMKERDNVPGFEFSATKDQVKRAEKIVDYLIESQVKSKEKTTPKPTRSGSSSPTGRKTKAADKARLNAAIQVYTADTKAKRDAALSSLNDEDYVEFRYKKLPPETVNGQTVTPIEITGIPADVDDPPVLIGVIGRGIDDWLETSGSQFIGVTDLNKAKSEAGYDPNKQYSLGTQDWNQSFYYDPTIPETQAQLEREDNWWNENLDKQITNVTSGLSDSDKINEDKVAPLLTRQPLLKFFGFSVKPDTRGREILLYKDNEVVVGVEGSDADGVMDISTVAASNTSLANIRKYIERHAKLGDQEPYINWIEANEPPQ